MKKLVKKMPLMLTVFGLAFAFMLAGCQRNEGGGTTQVPRQVEDRTPEAAPAVTADRAVVEDFFRAYETFVVELETLSRRDRISALDMVPIAQRTLEFAQRTAAIENDPAFVLADATALANLSLRYASAMLEINNRLQQAAPAIPAIPGIPRF